MPISAPTDDRVTQRDFELAVRELELRRREALVRRAEQAAALPRVPSSYFDCGANEDEDEWWAKQFGPRRSFVL